MARGKKKMEKENLNPIFLGQRSLECDSRQFEIKGLKLKS
jgi:hypothetical protein